MKRAAVLMAAAVSACAAQPRFKDQPIVWRVDDQRDIPEPEPNEYSRFEYLSDIFLFRQSTRALELRDSEPARDTNALDEVPSSSWFTNRVGVRAVSPEEAARGAGVIGPPQLPLQVTAGKSGGGNPGFLVKDATGRKFLVKFDPLANPEQQTATDVIVSRLFWVFGYNVPADYVTFFQRSDLTIREGAQVTNDLKEKRPMTDADVDRVLATSPRRPDGSYRAIASEFLPGKPLGGILPEGVREDDPNDTIPHEHRRVLRGLKVFGAWLNHTDMKEDNTLDMWVEENGKHFVRHYLVDFGEALAAHAAEKGRLEDGYEYFWDWRQQTYALFAFGLWKREWENLRETKWPSVGVFSAEHFDLDGWHEAYPYWPIVESDAADVFWAAKIALRVDRPVLEAIVGEAQLSEPDAARYLVDTLIARRDIIGAAALAGVTPLDELAIDGGRLCGVDLSVKYRFSAGVVIELLDEGGSPARAFATDSSGRVCLPVPESSDYAVLRLRAAHGAIKRPPMELHLKGGADARILGLIRRAPDS